MMAPKRVPFLSMTGAEVIPTGTSAPVLVTRRICWTEREVEPRRSGSPRKLTFLERFFSLISLRIEKTGLLEASF